MLWEITWKGHLSWAPPKQSLFQFRLLPWSGKCREIPFHASPDHQVSHQKYPLEDFLEPQVSSDINLSVIYYRIYAVDELGREGQLSDPCSLKLAPVQKQRYSE